MNSSGKSIVFECVAKGNNSSVVPPISKPASMALLCGCPQNGSTLTDIGDATMNKDLPDNLAQKLKALNEARTAHNQNAQALTDVAAGIARCHQQKKDTEVESYEAESQWRTLFRTLRGEITPELQAQHHSRIAKRELAKEFDGLIEEMELDKIELHLKCGNTAPQQEAAHKSAMRAFAEYQMGKAVDAFNAAVINTDIINACVLAQQAYGVYQDDTKEVIEKRLMGAFWGQLKVSMALQKIEHPVLKEISLQRPTASGVLKELQDSPACRMKVAKEVAEKRKALQQKGGKS
ncbi:MAG: NAD-dependent aldehyde dehydrogenase [Rouxiella badensis]|uniref:NAD-dependent aldehyde dehydrogenase n=1 Tax=Rouxiella badensis TaxID=1646377 RepID=UPI003C577959